MFGPYFKAKNSISPALNGSFRRMRAYEEKRDKDRSGYIGWSSPGVSVKYTGSQDG